MANTNYDGRSIDILIFQDHSYNFTKEDVRISWFANERGDGKICTGIVKMAQKAIVVLLTHTQFFDRRWSTDLPTAVFGSGSLTKAQQRIEQDFGIYAQQALELLQAQELVEDPRDEKIRDILLEDISIDRGQGIMNLSIRIEVLSGDDTVLVIPIANPLL